MSDFMWVYWMNGSLWKRRFLCFNDADSEFPQKRHTVSTSALTWALPWPGNPWRWRLRSSQCHIEEGENLFQGVLWAVCWSGHSPWWAFTVVVTSSRWTFIPLGWHASRTNSQLECNADPSVDIFPEMRLNYTSRCSWCRAFCNNFLAEHWMERTQEKTPQEMKESSRLGPLSQETWRGGLFLALP